MQIQELGLMDGKTDTAFAPDGNMTRADLVEALYRLAGKPAANGENPFTDVAADAAYKDAVIWANAQGIVSGVNDTAFNPNGDVKRQEIAKILNLFAANQVGRKELSNRIDKLSCFADASDVAPWARTYMNWAVASKFITSSRLDPNGTTTRAQAAAILRRYMADASTGDASKDKSRNEDNIGENELLVVSYGTSYNDNRVATIGAIEDALEKAFPDYSVRRGFTSNIIIEHIYRRDGQVIDGVEEALDRAKANGVKNLLVQPTHMMNGYEYSDLVKALKSRAADFESVKIGDPLLTSEEDYNVVSKAMVDAAASFDDGKTAVCFMGHGAEAASNGIYDRMQKIFFDGGYENYFVGTVKAHPDVEDVLKMVQAGEYERVILRPMMIVAGEHANNDMADESNPESWHSVFAAAGYEVVNEMMGLGELEGVQRLLVEHVRNAKTLDGASVGTEPNPEHKKAGKPAAGTLADGVYTIKVTSDSKMFRVAACELTVVNGEMTAVLTLSGAGYSKMYAGAAADAGNAKEGVIDFVEDAGGAYTFTVPVEALDQELVFAALGTKWYDRSLTFASATLAAK